MLFGKKTYLNYFYIITNYNFFLLWPIRDEMSLKNEGLNPLGAGFEKREVFEFFNHRYENLHRKKSWKKESPYRDSTNLFNSLERIQPIIKVNLP